MTDRNPGFYRRKVGDLVVTALNDGVGDLPFGALASITEDEAKALLARAFRPPVARTTIGAYLVQGGGRTVLIDTGVAGGFGPASGFLPANMQAAGVQPGDVDAILLTHLHVDHVNGLNKDGAAAFPNATVHVAQAELDYWMDDGNAAKVPEANRGAFGTARNALGPYKDRQSAFTAGAVAPGITAVPLPGHTPGHTGFRIESGGDALLIWGDVIHLQDIQAPRPDVGLVFDVDATQARETRLHTLDMATADRLLVAGMHLSFPTFYHVAKAAEGYALVPAMWQPVD